jgi:S-adenosylmethionine:tRNA ribosyltransferase-isomerase
MNVSDYDYDLPEELIAHRPCPDRAGSRMLVLSRATGDCRLGQFREFPSLLRAGDCLVLNDTKVIPARLFGRRQGFTGRVEAFLLEPVGTGCWRSLLKPGRRMKAGTVVEIEGTDKATFTVVEANGDGTFTIAFQCADVDALLEQAGHIPLPPYIARPDEATDKDRYQTVYAERRGAVAAPTAGLHFTPEILAEIAAKGIQIVRVTLHVGAGTFQPVKADEIADHVMHEEVYDLSPAAAAIINATRAAGGRVVAVGTTSVRVLETCADPATRQVIPGTGRTRLFMYPPRRPLVTDALLTNFHLPRSTLLMLVSCFASREQILAAYQLAIANRYRFYSFGDCMFIA